jgi:hypothetical protein
MFISSIRYNSHSRYPQHWQNGFFDRTSLYSLGFICHLGHDGDPCPIGPPPRNLTIIDTNGWHKVRVGFCTCDTKLPWNERYRQLLRMRWYPASFNRPRTAFSFDLLETYHKLTLQGKLNLFDFYLVTMQKSDNQGRSKTMVINLWLLPFNVAQEPFNSIDITRSHAALGSGEISKASNVAVVPIKHTLFPQQHLDHSRSSVPPARIPGETFQKTGTLPQTLTSEYFYLRVHNTRNQNFPRWMYAQFIAVDANFKLKLKNRKINDPELGSGWSYFVENSAYTNHVADNTQDQEVDHILNMRVSS